MSGLTTALDLDGYGQLLERMDRAASGGGVTIARAEGSPGQRRAALGGVQEFDGQRRTWMARIARPTDHSLKYCAGR